MFLKNYLHLITVQYLVVGCYEFRGCVHEKTRIVSFILT